MTKSKLILFIYIGIILIQSQTMKIRVFDFPPQYFKDKQGNWQGLDVELAKAVVEEAGFKCEFIDRPWTRALKEINNGTLDIMMNLTISKERSNYLNWIGPIRTSRIVLVVKKENVNLPIESIDDLAKISEKYKLTFGIQQDGFYSKEFNSKLKDPNFEKFFTKITNANQYAPRTNRNMILGFFENQVSMVYQIKTKSEFKDLAIHNFILSEDPVYLGVSKKVSKENFKKLKLAFEKLERNGSLQKIRSSYKK